MHPIFSLITASIQLAPFPGQIKDLLVPLVVLVLIWFAVRFIFRLAMRVFTIGCGLIVLVALVLFAIRFLS